MRQSYRCPHFLMREKLREPYHIPFRLRVPEWPTISFFSDAIHESWRTPDFSHYGTIEIVQRAFLTAQDGWVWAGIGTRRMERAKSFEDWILTYRCALVRWQGKVGYGGLAHDTWDTILVYQDSVPYGDWGHLESFAYGLVERLPAYLAELLL